MVQEQIYQADARLLKTLSVPWPKVYSGIRGCRVGFFVPIRKLTFHGSELEPELSACRRSFWATAATGNSDQSTVGVAGFRPARVGRYGDAR